MNGTAYGAAVRSTAQTNEHPPKMIAVPRKPGPGRRRMVDVNSLDGLAVQLANEIAAEIVERVREYVERTAQATIVDIVAKLDHHATPRR